MALRDTYGPNNKEVYELPVTVSISTRVSIMSISAHTGIYTYDHLEQITRESYAYVGMTAAAAAACAADMVALYTKNVGKPIVDRVTGAVVYEDVTMCVASVRAVHVGGRMYKVEIDRNEPSYTMTMVPGQE
jgi:Tfp pilus assembly protein PilV